jgi:hypothetical protein
VVDAHGLALVEGGLGAVGAGFVERAQGKKPEPTGIAAISGSAEQTENPAKLAFLHPCPGDLLKLEVPAARAVGVAHELPGNSARVEPALALHATPRAKSYHCGQTVAQSSSLRTNAALPATRGTNHYPYLPWNSFPPTKHRQAARLLQSHFCAEFHKRQPQAAKFCAAEARFGRPCARSL